MKKIIAMLLALIMVLGLVACGAKEEASSATEAATSAAAESATEAATEAAEEEHETVDLTLWFIATNEVPQYIKDLPEMVKKYYPWINLTCEHIPGEAITEKISVAYATDSCPDILLDGYSRIAPGVLGGLAVDITDIYEANKDIFYGEPLEGVVDGKHFYLPTCSGAPYNYIVNMSLAEELGVADMIPAIDESWSYEEFLALLRAAKAADPNVYPTALYAGNQSGDAWDYGMFLGNGASILNLDGTESLIAEAGNKEKIVEVLELYQTLANENLIADGAAALTDDGAYTLWCAGQLLLFPSAYNSAPDTIRQQEEGNCVEFEVGAVMQPTPTGEMGRTASWGSTGVAAFNSNGKGEAAKLVIDAMMKDQAWRQQLIVDSGYLPVHTDLSAEYATPELTELMAYGISYGAAYADSTFGILQPFWTDCRGVFYPLKQDLFTGNITPEEFVDKWDAGVSEIIANYNAG